MPTAVRPRAAQAALHPAKMSATRMSAISELSDTPANHSPLQGTTITVEKGSEPVRELRGARNIEQRRPDEFNRVSDKDLCARVISVVVPVYNEEEVLPAFHVRLVSVIERLDWVAQIVYINDGSTDCSAVTINRLRESDDRVALVNLSRNFGKEIAITAGLDHVYGDVTIVIDADLQDPPELIPELINKWLDGYDMVYATRRRRDGETWLKKATANAFYKLIHNIADTQIPENTGDFRLLSKRCVQALASCRERRRFMKGLFAWVGFRHISVPYDRDPRFAGSTKWNYWRLWNLAIEGITSFTIVPLRVATYFGLITAISALTYALIICARTLLWGIVVPGYASLMVAILLLAGVQLVAMGVIGEYVGRIFMEAKGRPLYLLDVYLSARNMQTPHAYQDTESKAR